MTRGEKAKELFLKGYNCSQAVVGAFADDLDIDFDSLIRLSSSFGGGMGRMREVCGAVTGSFMVAGLKCGYSAPLRQTAKSAHYALIQKLAADFKEQNGSIVCRELLEGAGCSGNASETFPTSVLRDIIKNVPAPSL